MEGHELTLWVARIEGLKSHLRIIQRDGDTSDHPGMERMARQATAGIAEADRYLSDAKVEVL
jgi:hypothetical protein